MEQTNVVKSIQSEKQNLPQVVAEQVFDPDLVDSLRMNSCLRGCMQLIHHRAAVANALAYASSNVVLSAFILTVKLRALLMSPTLVWVMLTKGAENGMPAMKI